MFEAWENGSFLKAARTGRCLIAFYLVIDMYLYICICLWNTYYTYIMEIMISNLVLLTVEIARWQFDSDLCTVYQSVAKHLHRPAVCNPGQNRIKSRCELRASSDDPKFANTRFFRRSHHRCTITSIQIISRNNAIQLWSLLLMTQLELMNSRPRWKVSRHSRTPTRATSRS